MSEILPPPTAQQNVLTSSLAEDVWHPNRGRNSYEWWYFDALSDDGREAVMVTFADNFVFSPRYVSASPSGESRAEPRRFPAVSFLYSVDGKAIFRTVNEFTEPQFSSSTDTIGCRIGESVFHVETASYGSGYVVELDIPVGVTKRLKCSFEWLSIDADLLPEKPLGENKNLWNIAAPRSDVSGRMEIVDPSGKPTHRFHFRGTGYHDHIAGADSLHETVKCRQWGRAHFVDTTAIYCIEHGGDGSEPNSRLLIVREGKLYERDAVCEQQQFRRDKFGIKYPRRLSFLTEDNIRLRVKPFRSADSGFFNVRLLSDMTLMLRDGKPRKAIGISEFLAPKNIKYRVFRWFADMQIRKDSTRETP